MSKRKILEKYEKAVSKQEKVGEPEFEEIEHKLKEENWESNEGLEIEEDEDKGEEAYPEIGESIKKEADEDEDE